MTLENLREIPTKVAEKRQDLCLKAKITHPSNWRAAHHQLKHNLRCGSRASNSAARVPPNSLFGLSVESSLWS